MEQNREIELEHVTFSDNEETVILNDITFLAQGSESIGLIGANGAGKSTLLKLLVGLCYPKAGTVTVGGFPVKKENLPAVREMTGYVFQDSDSQLFLTTAYEDVAFAPRNYGFSKEEVERRTEAAMELVHISHLRDKPIYQMSGGEKKLVSIATILSMEPDIVLMDEPSIALDPRNRRNLIEILNRFSYLKLIASHDLDLIWDTCERTILLYDGKLVADGATHEILQDRELLESCGLELPLRFSALH